ncbi:MAG TPA: hypothetical protein VLC09_05165, partial [Polyangiaceae bacterium]|nr:hypothetical protein [Polyangiaceae bacterium]
MTGQPGPTPHLLEAHDLQLLDGGERLLCPTLDLRGPTIALWGRAAWLVHAFRRPTLRIGGALKCRSLDAATALRQRELGYVTRRLEAQPGARVTATLRASAELLGVSPKRAEQQLEKLGLGALGRRRLDELTPSEERLVALAHGLLGEPVVLLIEDPFLGLDERGCERVEHAFLGELRGHSWLWTVESSTRAAQAVLDRASQVVRAEGERLVGPLLAREISPLAFWLALERPAPPELIEQLRQESASVDL